MAIPTIDWAVYKDVIDGANSLFNQNPIIWRKYNQVLELHGENENGSFSDITLKGLAEYNAFRKWPEVQGTESGELDRVDCVIHFNLKYLRDLGYLNSTSNLDYDITRDRFIVDGITYKCAGETHTSQTDTEPLILQMVLIREETLTGENRY